MMLSNLIKFPLIFISGIFLPISQMSNYKGICYISPLTFYTDIARHSVEGTGYFNPLVDLVTLLGFGVLFTVLAIKWHKKSLAKRF